MAMALPSLAMPPAGRKAVGWWLVAIALLIAAMVTLGGLTRLTGSGLSITEWHPVTGVVPPLSDRDWQSEFAKYQQIPQYRLENRGMSLTDFKAIYWWEWTHRLLGRLIGLVFFAPLVFFIAMRTITRAELPRMLALFALGGLQGFVGWWMVESGLETRVSVSQYRLAIHLGVAILLFGAVLWTAFEYLSAQQATGGSRRRHSHWYAFALLALVYVQMLLGAFVAGLHGGFIYNTWPSMDGRLFPEGALFFRPWWINLFENAGLAQFDHRLGAYLVAAAVLALWVVSRRYGSAVRRSADLLIAVVSAQVALGILTLVNQAPVPLAALHQAAAVALFSAALWHLFTLSREDYATASA
jgi:cytochrome c oxidase assembly protein subunit 15